MSSAGYQPLRRHSWSERVRLVFVIVVPASGLITGAPRYVAHAGTGLDQESYANSVIRQFWFLRTAETLPATC